MTKILVVDDKQDDQRLAASALGTSRCAVEFAETAETALVRIEANSIDLVVTDVRLPGMDGIEFIMTVLERHPQVPIVVLTDSGNTSLAVDALHAGASSFVAKQRIIHDLGHTVQRVLKAAHADRTATQILRRMIDHSWHIVIETEVRMLDALSQYLRRVVHSIQGLGPGDHGRLTVAIDEALTNAFYHGNLELSSELRDRDTDEFKAEALRRCEQHPYRDRKIHMMASISQTEATFVIRDEGPGFNARAYIDMPQQQNLTQPSGRGILLMRSFLDRVSFNDKGNEIALTKHLDPTEE